MTTQISRLKGRTDGKRSIKHSVISGVIRHEGRPDEGKGKKGK